MFQLRKSRRLFKESLCLDRSVKDNINCYGGGGGKSSPKVTTVAATPQPAPPQPAPPVEEATMKTATDKTADKAKATAKSQGAASLQIPLGTVSSTSTVGTV